MVNKMQHVGQRKPNNPFEAFVHRIAGVFGVQASEEQLLVLENAIRQKVADFENMRQFGDKDAVELSALRAEAAADKVSLLTLLRNARNNSFDVERLSTVREQLTATVATLEKEKEDIEKRLLAVERNNRELTNLCEETNNDNNKKLSERLQTVLVTLKEPSAACIEELIQANETSLIHLVKLGDPDAARIILQENEQSLLTRAKKHLAELRAPSTQEVNNAK